MVRAFVEPGHERVRHRAITPADRVGQVHEGFGLLEAGAARGLARRLRHLVIEERAHALQRQGALGGEDPEAQPQVLEAGGASERPGKITLARLARDENGIDLFLHAEGLLQQPQGQEDRVHLLRTRLEGELTQLAWRQDPLQGQPDGAGGLVASAEERARGHARGRLDAQQQGGPRLASDLAGQGLADQRIAPLEPG